MNQNLARDTLPRCETEADHGQSTRSQATASKVSPYCIQCDDTGHEENGGYEFACRHCEAGKKVKLADMYHKIEANNRENRRLKKQIVALLGNITSTTAALSNGNTKK